MGLLIDVNAKNNHIGVEFKDAYFSIQDAKMIISDNVPYIVYSFDAYPSRELKIASVNYQPISGMSWGGNPNQPYYSASIYYYGDTVEASKVFPGGIPVTSDEIKAGVYEYFKDMLDEKGVSYKDVIEN